MSNIKLKDHNWATDGIYDTNQSKTQKTINSDVNTIIGNTSMGTTATTLTGAVKEINTKIGTTATNFQTALNSLHKIYTTVSEIGLSGTPTLVQVANALPNGSMFLADSSAVTMTDMTDYAQINIVLVCRVSTAKIFSLGLRSFAGVVLSNSDIYYASYSSTNSTFVGWISLNRGKLSTAGGTMTGALTVKTSNYASGTAPTDKAKFAPFFQLADASNNNLVFFQGTSYVNGDEGFEITTRRNNNGTWVYNTLRLLLDSSFNPVVYLGSPDAWRTALGLSYAKGDTESFTASCLCTVLVTNNSKNIYFDFDLPKSLENISTVSVTTMNGAFRGADGGAATGYIDYWGNRNWASVSGYTPSVTKLGSHRIRIALVKTTQYHYITDDQQTVGNVVPTNSMSTYWGTLSFSFS